MILGNFTKTPTKVEDYPIDCAPWLGTDTLSSATTTVECTSTPANTALTVVSTTVAPAGLVVRLSEGTAGESYLVKVLATSSTGRVELLEFTIAVELPVPALTYHDAYLAPLVTPEREQRALADVDDIATFPDAWRSKLAVLRAYIITATESQRTADDLFSVRLKRYQEEYRQTLPLARAAADAASGTTGAGSLISVSLERA